MGKLENKLVSFLNQMFLRSLKVKKSQKKISHFRIRKGLSFGFLEEMRKFLLRFSDLSRCLNIRRYLFSIWFHPRKNVLNHCSSIFQSKMPRWGIFHISLGWDHTENTFRNTPHLKKDKNLRRYFNFWWVVSFIFTKMVSTGANAQNYFCHFDDFFESG